MLERLQVLQAQNATLRGAIEESLVKGCDLHDQHARHVACGLRVQQLLRQVEQRRCGVAELRARLEASRIELAEQSDQLELTCRAKSGTAEEERQRAASEMPTLFNGLRSSRRQLRYRQMQMLHEASQVYPIEGEGENQTIRGLCIANSDTLVRQDLREEETASAALGFLAHLFVTLASILQVPLRILIHYAGSSRCCLSAPLESLDTSTKPGEWPLYYGKGLEKSRFDTALRMFRDCMRQFLYSRGYDPHSHRTLGKASQSALCGNIVECVSSILREELRGIR